MGYVDSTFPFGSGLPAARALARLADEVETCDRELVGAAAAAQTNFLGPVRTAFDDRRADDNLSARRTADALRQLADGIAANWARERGNQDRANWARWRDAQIARDNWLENLYEWFVGEDDYGPPPDDPRTPQGPDYAETRGPQYAAYGP